MATEVTIVIKATQQNAEAFQKTSDGLQQIQRSAASAGEATKMSLTDIKSGIDLITGAATTVYNMFDQMNSMGAELANAQRGFEAFGGTTAILNQMRDSTKGLVDDVTLLHNGMQALSAGVVTNVHDLAELDRIGATLGRTFMNDAAGGIETLIKDIEMVGSTRGLKTLGIDAQAVKERFEQLKATMSDQDAWRMAVLGVAAENANKLSGALTGTGTAWEKFTSEVSNEAHQMGENFATGLDAIMHGVEEISKHPPQIVIPVIFQQVGDLLGGSTSSTVANMIKNNTDGGGIGMSAARWGAEVANGGGISQPPPTMLPTTRSGSGMSGYGAVTGSDEAGYERIKQGQEYNDLLRFGLSLLNSTGDAIRSVTHESGMFTQSLQEQYAALQKRQSGLAGAFGLNQTGTAGELGGMLESGLAQGRAAVEKGNGHWRSQKQKDADLATFDAESQRAMDAYALATGAATQQSLKLRDVAGNLSASMSNGQLSVMGYAKAIDALRQAAEGGYASLANLQAIQIKSKIEDSGGSGTSFLSYHPESLNVNTNDKTGATKPDDPFGSYGTSADAVKGKVDKLNQSTAQVGTTATTAGSTAATAFVGMSNNAKAGAENLGKVTTNMQGAADAAPKAGSAISNGMKPANSSLSLAAETAVSLKNTLLSMPKNVDVNVNVHTNGGNKDGK